MSSPLESLQVLLADDNQHMRAIVAAVLKGVGVKRIREVSDGAEALHVLREFPAALAIVDFNMAPMDGVEFTRYVRTDSYFGPGRRRVNDDRYAGPMRRSTDAHVPDADDAESESSAA